jgi:hypothetical protein
VRARSFALFTVLLAGACSYPLATECGDTRHYERQTEVRTFRHPNGVVSATGRGMRAEWDDPFSSELPTVRFGPWTYQYDNGVKRAEVTYAIGCYLHCCTAGPCPHPYDYPVGAFTIWYPSGKKLGEGAFAAAPRHFDTNCEGGATGRGGRVAESSKFWREDGSEMTLPEARATGLLLPGW